MKLNKFGAPFSVKFCKKCVISNQRPSSTVEFISSKTLKKKTIDFNNEQVCSACRYNSQKNCQNPILFKDAVTRRCNTKLYS